MRTLVYCVCNVRTKSGQNTRKYIKIMANTEKRTRSFNLPVEIIGKLEKLAVKKNRSTSAQLSEILENYFEKETTEAKQTLTAA